MAGPYFKSVVEEVRKIFPDGGTILEFGVSRGGSFSYLANQIKSDWPCKLIGFDSFQGLPKETEGVWYPERHSEGRYCSPLELTISTIKSFGITLPDERFELVPGWFKDSLTEERRKDIKNLIFVNVDVDLYNSTIELLNFIRPLLQKGTLIYFDDWKDPKDKFDGKWGEHLAFERWSAKNPEIKFRQFSVDDRDHQRTLEVVDIKHKMIKNIRHTGIVVKNLEESLRFYQLLGFTIYQRAKESVDFISKISDKEGIVLNTVKLLAPNNSMMELLDYGKDKMQTERTMFETGMAHIAFTVEDLEEVYNRLKEKGIYFNSSPQISPNRYAKVVFCRAPEGTFIELVEVL